MSTRVPRLVTMGESLGVVASTRPGLLSTGRDARLAIAGSESNVAIGVSRLGARATWIGHVGDDAFGRLILSELSGEGVDVRSTYKDRPTGLLIREQRTAGLARVSYHRADSAGSQLVPEDVPDDVLEDADVLHVTGITMALGDGPAAAVDRLVHRARETGVLVSLDLNYRANLWSREAAADALRPLLALADIVFAGDDEAALFAPYDKPEVLARVLRDAGATTAVVTLGARGSHALHDGVDYQQDAYAAVVVDSVGAGDAFVAGYLADLMLGAGPAQCLETAAVVAAFAVGTVGDWEGLPRRSELSLMRSRDDTMR